MVWEPDKARISRRNTSTSYAYECPPPVKLTRFLPVSFDLKQKYIAEQAKVDKYCTMNVQQVIGGFVLCACQNMLVAMRRCKASHLASCRSAYDVSKRSDSAAKSMEAIPNPVPGVGVHKNFTYDEYPRHILDNSLY